MALLFLLVIMCWIIDLRAEESIQADVIEAYIPEQLTMTVSAPEAPEPLPEYDEEIFKLITEGK